MSVTPISAKSINRLLYFEFEPRKYDGESVMTAILGSCLEQSYCSSRFFHCKARQASLSCFPASTKSWVHNGYAVMIMHADRCLEHILDVSGIHLKRSRSVQKKSPDGDFMIEPRKHIKLFHNVQIIVSHLRCLDKCF